MAAAWNSSCADDLPPGAGPAEPVDARGEDDDPRLGSVNRGMPGLFDGPAELDGAGGAAVVPPLSSPLVSQMINPVAPPATTTAAAAIATISPVFFFFGGSWPKPPYCG
ncbi:hypothetical protein [Amycolatopsis jejuensis]|uniref:hypothetical protein n=1 Tax=Amycolatopsis jejuensis TaxID=330084 RepID=UPI00069009D9|nr:hypothetical protein [Amycolatopsis jejuensis]